MTTPMEGGVRHARTYGGWRQARGIGLFGLGPLATVTVLAAVTTPLIAASLSVRAGFLTSLPATAVAFVTLARVNGHSLAHLLTRRLRWSWGSARGWTTYRATTVADHSGEWDLPGVLAPTRLISARAGSPPGTYGLVWNRRTGHLTATLRCAAASTWLVDDQDADGWVSNWHAWLAALGYQPMIRAVAVTVDTAPEPGTTLQDAVMTRVAPDAPGDVTVLMRELVRRSPAASADVDTRVTVTFDPAVANTRPSDLDEAVAEVGRLLTGLESSLTSCGVTVLGWASARELAGTVRVAFDPAMRGDVERLLSPAGGGSPLPWVEAGPVAAVEGWDCYRHDSGVSVTWGWREAPRQLVAAGVLNRLLSPGRFAKRVTLVYRPLPAGEAARVLGSQVNAAAFRDAYRRAQHRDESARDVADRVQAQRAAAEEAQGAGVVMMTLYVTVTVTDPDQLPVAVADVETRAEQSKVRLRRLYGGQAAGFAMTLPVGFAGWGR